MKSLLPGLAIAALGGCAAPAATVQSAATPAFVSEEAARIASRLDAYFGPLADSGDFSGTIRARAGDGSIVTRHYGYADVAEKRLHDDATRYGFGSVTKSVTAVTLLSLERAGKVDLDQPLAAILPAFEGRTAATMRDVLLHRAGLPRDFPSEHNPIATPTSDWLLADEGRLGPVGERAYSNVGYALLAEMIEASTGQPYATLVEAHALRPAGLRNSLIAPLAYDAPGVATPYMVGASATATLPPPPHNPEVGGSGLVGTVEDLMRWADFLASDAYPELFEGSQPLGSISLRDDEDGARLSLQGTLPGYGANAIVWRDGRRAIAFAGNLFGAPMMDMEQRLVAVVGDEPLPDPRPSPSATALTDAHRALAGRYRHPDYGEIAIAEDDECACLMLTLVDWGEAFTFGLVPLPDGQLHARAIDDLVWREAEGSVVMAPRASPGAVTTLEPTQ